MLDDRRILAEAHGARGGALSMQGRVADSLRAYAQVIPAADAIGDLDTLGSTLNSVGHIQILQGDLALARQTIARAITVAETLGNEEGVAFETLGSCLIHYYAGDWGQARREGAWALSVSRRTGTQSSWKAAFALFALSYICLGEGTWDEARAYLEECVAAAERTHSLTLQRRAQALLAELDLQEGRAEAARGRLALLPEQGQHETAMDTEVLWRLAWAHLELGAMARAQEVLEPTLARLRAERLRVALVHALGVEARLALRQERWREAIQALDEGVSLARAIPYPYGEARLLHLDGLLQLQRHAPARAREQLEAALAIFARLGARRDRERADQVLEELSQNDGMGRFETAVSDAQWAQVRALLPPPARTGRRRADDRRTLEAILYQRRTGCAWAGLPAAYGDEATAHRRLRQWQAAGLWERIVALVQTPSMAGQGRDHGADAPPEAGSGPLHGGTC
jgi:transposase